MAATTIFHLFTGLYQLLLSRKVLQTSAECLSGEPEEVWQRPSVDILEGIWSFNGRSVLSLQR